jgi:hypothetical protein
MLFDMTLLQHAHVWYTFKYLLGKWFHIGVIWLIGKYTEKYIGFLVIGKLRRSYHRNSIVEMFENVHFTKDVFTAVTNEILLPSACRNALRQSDIKFHTNECNVLSQISRR